MTSVTQLPRLRFPVSQGQRAKMGQQDYRVHPEHKVILATPWNIRLLGYQGLLA